MPRFAAANPESTAGKTKTLLDAVKAKLGVVPNMMRTMAASPAVLESYVGMSGTLAHGELSLKTREQIALLCAQLTACDYCLAAHTVIGAKAGLTPAEIAGARRGQSSDVKAAGALSLAKSIVEKRGAVSQQELAAARGAGLSDAQLLEVVAHVSFNLFTNLFNKFTETEIDFPKVAAA